MVDSNIPIQSTQTTPDVDEPRSARRLHAARQWRNLGNQLMSITPGALVRTGLILSGGLLAAWVVRESWPAPLPFLIGGVIAYLVLPAVNRLSVVMPRILASTIMVVLVLTLLFGTVGLVARAIALDAYNAYQSLPDQEQIDEYVEDVDQLLAGLPDPIEQRLREGLRSRLLETRTEIRERAASIDNPLQRIVVGVINGIGAVLGLFILPIWLLVVLRDQHRARGAINRTLPQWVQGDFWGIVRLMDRTMGAYLRGIVLTGIALGVVTTAGLVMLDSLGFEGIRYPLTMGLVVAVLELVPVLGPVVAAATLVAMPATTSLESSAAVLGLVILSRLLVKRQMTSRLDRRVIDLHPGILLVVIAAFSQFGIFWTLLAVPAAALIRDVFRYAYGRFGDPARPAGVLPGEVAPSRTGAKSLSARRVPLVYQRNRLATTPRIDDHGWHRHGS